MGKVLSLRQFLRKILNRKSGMYDSVKMGEYLAAYAVRKGYFMNQTKLQKLLYILYGAYLTQYDKILVDEQPEAWPYGPVFPRVQKKFAKVDNLAYANIADGAYENIREDEKLQSLIDSVLHTFGEWTAQALSVWSHKQGSPWAVALANNGMKYSAVISSESIKEYFKTFMNL
ncbi:Panacea domain-containing protein [uncultured Alistipes sp.]|uniref:Panacea domain-containing protein n=1 Tax=uncultured Alistipes sp. TaxID=538949 RepID=UPI00272A3FA7|nr:type II toxin-antitoxin system antitoxin SocA domain-containing protein [uncultured Alistipes sp.]